MAEIFDKHDEMKKDLDRVDAREDVFAENVKAKFGDQKLVYLRVTDNDIRYYAYGHFGYFYDTYHCYLCRLLNLHAGLWDCLPRSYYETDF